MNFLRPVLMNQFDIWSDGGGSGGGAPEAAPQVNGFGADQNGFRFLDRANGVAIEPEKGQGDTSLTNFRPLPIPNDAPLPKQLFGPSGQLLAPSQQQTGQGQQQQSAPQQFALAPQSIQALGQQLSQLIPQPQQQVAPPPSEAEYRQKTGYPVVSEQFSKALFGDTATPQQQNLLQVLTDTIIKHTLTVAGMAFDNLHQTLTTRMDQSLGPVQEMARTQQQNQLMIAVSQAYPVLDQFKAVLPHALEFLKQRKFMPTSPDDAIKNLAGAAEYLIKMTRPEFSLQSAAPNQQQAGGGAFSGGGGRNMPQMNQQMNNGGAGGAGGASGATKKSSWSSVFE